MAQICQRLVCRSSLRQVALFQCRSMTTNPAALTSIKAVKILSNSLQQIQHQQLRSHRIVPVDLGDPVALKKKKPTKQEVDDRVIKAVKTFDRLPQDKELKFESHFMNDLGLDSLDHVEIIMAIEEEFDIEVPDADAENLLTPRQIADYICVKQDVVIS